MSVGPTARAPGAILIGPPRARETTVGTLLAAQPGGGITANRPEHEADGGEAGGEHLLRGGRPALQGPRAAGWRAGRVSGDGLRGGGQARWARPGPPAADRQPPRHAEDTA